MAFAAHSEMGESSEVIAACSETNFAVQLFKKFFKDKEIKKITKLLAEQRERNLYPCLKEEDIKRKCSKACDCIRGQKQQRLSR